MRGPHALCESIAELIENGEFDLQLDAVGKPFESAPHSPQGCELQANETDVQCQNGDVGEQQAPHATVFAPRPHSRRQAQLFRRFPDVQSRDGNLLREKEAEGDLLGIHERHIFGIDRLVLHGLSLLDGALREMSC